LRVEAGSPPFHGHSLFEVTMSLRASLRLAEMCTFALTIGAGGAGAQTVAQSSAPIGRIERLDPALDALVPRDARLEKLADGFAWTEGPVWRKSGGYLLFSDIPNNAIVRWKQGEGTSLFLRPAGYTGPTPLGRELGSNGLTFDSHDKLVMADHGNRQIARLNDSNFTKTTLADRYDGKRFNSPNDLVYHSNGDLYFTDPPYGIDEANRPKRGSFRSAVCIA
jgi:gluconolactonase